jgi:hypothetical protein
VEAYSVEMRLYSRVFDELNRQGLRYVVVGGLAVVLHGHPRLTMDADLVVALDEPNALSVIEALTKLGFVPRAPVDPKSFASQAIRESWIRDRNMMVFSMADPKNPFFAIDLFVDPPLAYDELAASALSKEVDGVPIIVCSIADLKRMKRRSGRPEDLADIAALEEIERGI